MKKVFNKAKNFNVRTYYEMQKIDPNLPVPWRYVQVPGELNEPRLQVAVFHKWKAIKPPAPLLMLHGLTGNHKQFNPLIRHTNYPWGILSLDLRGYGGSEKAPSFYEIQNQVSDIERLGKFFKRPFFNVIAYDYGGSVAIRLARRYPERIGCIILIQSGRPFSSFSSELKTSYQEEIKLFTDQVKSKEEYHQKIFGNELTMDQKDFLNYNLKEIQGNLITRLSKDAIQQNLSDFENQIPTEESISYVQHPILLIRSEFGFKHGTPNHYLTNKDVKELERICNVKEVVTIKGSTHRDIISKHGKEIMEKAEGLIEKYDLQRILDTRVDKMRTKEEIERSFSKFYGKNGILEYLIKK